MSGTLAVHTSCSILTSHNIGIVVSYNTEGGGCNASMVPAYVSVVYVHVEEQAPKREYRDVCFLLMTLVLIRNLPQHHISTHVASLSTFHMMHFLRFFFPGVRFDFWIEYW